MCLDMGAANTLSKTIYHGSRMQPAPSHLPKLFLCHWCSLRTRHIDLVILKTAEKWSCRQNRKNSRWMEGQEQHRHRARVGRALSWKRAQARVIINHPDRLTPSSPSTGSPSGTQPGPWHLCHQWYYWKTCKRHTMVGRAYVSELRRDHFCPKGVQYSWASVVLICSHCR